MCMYNILELSNEKWYCLKIDQILFVKMSSLLPQFANTAIYFWNCDKYNHLPSLEVIV